MAVDACVTSGAGASTHIGQAPTVLPAFAYGHGQGRAYDPAREQEDTPLVAVDAGADLFSRVQHAEARVADQRLVELDDRASS
jgi:hypothetical protein